MEESKVADLVSLDELLSWRAQQRGDAPLFAWWEDRNAMVKTTRSLSYADVDVAASRVAERLRSELAPGDRAVLVFEPGLAFIVAFFGCGRAGGVAVPVFPPEPRKKSTAELEAFLSIRESSGAELALTSPAYNWAKKAADLSRLDLRGRRWPEKLRWVVVDESGGGGGASKADPGGAVRGAHEVAFLQYTSGSTSEPKGVVITQRSLLHNLSLIVSELAATERTVCVSWLPQYHDMGLIGSYLGTLRCGGRGHYASPITFVKRPASWLEAISLFRGTHTQAPNFAFALAVRKPPTKQLDLSCVEHMINAAEPVERSVLDAFEALFCAEHSLPRGVVFPTYGLAEHTVMVCSNGRATR